ncbi:MAG: DUF1249 domain-containing protein [Chromatiales bacterium]|nr:DUF1249 domain-containing protein [Chromatiales bacterium]
MTLYEGNYVRLQSILPEMPPAGSILVSHCVADLDLHLRVEAATRYTRELYLTYLFLEDGAAGLARPDLRLRVYLDARLVEVCGWSVDGRHHVLRRLGRQWPGEIDRRWAASMMLGKWLEYLADRGHSFSGKVSIDSTKRDQASASLTT